MTREIESALLVLVNQYICSYSQISFSVATGWYLLQYKVFTKMHVYDMVSRPNSFCYPIKQNVTTTMC